MVAAGAFFTELFVSLPAAAQEVASEHALGIPAVVWYQFLNFGLLMVILYFALRKRVAAYFKARHLRLTTAIQEAREVKQQAEKKYEEYKLKLEQVEQESARLLSQVRQEAEATRAKILQEAQVLVQTIEAESKRVASYELEKARSELYDDVLAQAIEGARVLLKKSMAEPDQLRLQKEFVHKIEAAK